MKGSAALSRCVCLGDSNHAVNMLRRNAESNSYAAGCRTGGCNVREGPVIDIEQRALSAFEEDSLAFADHFVQQHRRVAHESLDLFTEPCVRIADRIRINDLRIF